MPANMDDKPSSRDSTASEKGEKGKSYIYLCAEVKEKKARLAGTVKGLYSQSDRWRLE